MRTIGLSHALDAASETAVELQTRAKEYLAKLEAEQDAERKALGVEDSLKEIAGLTTAMLVALGKGDVKTLEDFAGSRFKVARGGGARPGGRKGEAWGAAGRTFSIPHGGSPA